MDKPLLFISHIAEEKDVALALKSLVEETFLGMIEIFVSSDESSVPLGQKWLEAITSSLKRCVVEIVIASPTSVKRPWINFEAGAGWVRDIPVIPLCHSGMTPGALPVPLNLLQAATATEVSQLKLVFPVLATALGSTSPTPDFASFIKTVKEFEEQYVFWDGANTIFADIKKVHAEIIPALRQGRRVTIDLTETQIHIVEQLVPFLVENRLITFERVGNVRMTPSGTYYDCYLTPQARLAATLADERFQH